MSNNKFAQENAFYQLFELLSKMSSIESTSITPCSMFRRHKRPSRVRVEIIFVEEPNFDEFFCKVLRH